MLTMKLVLPSRRRKIVTVWLKLTVLLRILLEAKPKFLNKTRKIPLLGGFFEKKLFLDFSD